jgi:biopolymer transport protein TolR
MAEINVVPYIDVMLVLLIIFMVTAPMLMQGVKVDLPEANADPVENQQRRPGGKPGQRAGDSVG